MTNLDIKVFDHLVEFVLDVVGVSTTIDDDAEVFGDHGGPGFWHGER
jgi:hypothetical protein